MHTVFPLKMASHPHVFNCITMLICMQVLCSNVKQYLQVLLRMRPLSLCTLEVPSSPCKLMAFFADDPIESNSTDVVRSICPPLTTEEVGCIRENTGGLTGLVCGDDLGRAMLLFVLFMFTESITVLC